MDEQNPDGITAYHGSPHEFERFDTSKIGTGEGAQAFGHGLYFAEAEPVAKEYRDALQNPTISVKGKEFPLASQAANEIYPYEDLSYPENINWSEVLYPIHHALTKMQNYEMDLDAAIDDMRSSYSHYKPEYVEKAEQLIRSVKPEIKNKGHMYEVHIDAHPDHFLDWDKPLSEQSEYVKNALANHTPLQKNRPYKPEDTGRDVYYKNTQGLGGKDIASNELMSLGIHGIRYLDAGSRGPLASWSTDKLTHNYVVFDHGRVNIKRRYAEGGEVEGYGDGGEIPNPMSIFPKPQRMFPEDAPVAGGQYLSMPDKTDVTGHKAAVASIGVYPGGKPYFTASRDAVEETGTPGRGSATAKTNLFKQKAGWKWKDAPEGHENTNTIVSVEHRGQHHYTLNAHFPKGVDLARYENSPSEPRLRPTTKGNVELGPVAGSILVRGREHPVYHHVIVKNAGGEVDGYDNGGSTYEPHKRAEEQGYEIKGYHVTRGSSAGQISSARRFDPARNMMNEPATFFWDNPKAANEWAHYVTGASSFDPNEMLDRHVDRVERHATAVMPVRIKKGKHLVVNWDNTTGSPFYDNKRMASILNNARDQGYDTVRIKNMIETGPMSVEDFERGYATGEFPQAHDQIAVLNPAMIRSEFAQFDPERQHENDIGANAGGYIHKGDGGRVGFDDGGVAPNPGDIATGGFGSGSIGGGRGGGGGGPAPDSGGSEGNGSKGDIGGGGQGASKSADVAIGGIGGGASKSAAESAEEAMASAGIPSARSAEDASMKALESIMSTSPTQLMSSKSLEALSIADQAHQAARQRQDQANALLASGVPSKQVYTQFPELNPLTPQKQFTIPTTTPAPIDTRPTAYEMSAAMTKSSGPLSPAAQAAKEADTAEAQAQAAIDAANARSGFPTGMQGGPSVSVAPPAGEIGPNKGADQDTGEFEGQPTTSNVAMGMPGRANPAAATMANIGMGMSGRVSPESTTTPNVGMGMSGRISPESTTTPNIGMGMPGRISPESTVTPNVAMGMSGRISPASTATQPAATGTTAQTTDQTTKPTAQTTLTTQPPMPPIPYRDFGEGTILDSVATMFGLGTQQMIDKMSQQYLDQGMSPSDAAIRASYDLRDLQANLGKILQGDKGGGNQQKQPSKRMVYMLMPDGTYQLVEEPYKRGGVAKKRIPSHNSAIVEHALAKISAPPPALGSSFMVAKRGRPF